MVAGRTSGQHCSRLPVKVLSILVDTSEPVNKRVDDVKNSDIWMDDDVLCFGKKDFFSDCAVSDHDNFCNIHRVVSLKVLLIIFKRQTKMF